MGYYQAKLVGDALRDSGIRIDNVFSSPAFRCIQTATGLLEGLGVKDEKPLNLEPGLFEWLAWYADGVPDWCESDDLIASNYNIDKTYKPVMSVDELRAESQETSEQFYKRNHAAMDSILAKTSESFI